MQIAMGYGALERLMRMYTNRTEVIEARTKALHAISALVLNHHTHFAITAIVLHPYEMGVRY